MMKIISIIILLSLSGCCFYGDFKNVIPKEVEDERTTLVYSIKHISRFND